ncbi:MAG: hypothetical protein ACAI38_08470 [Myxococcota bacterium]|nr:hypothetical protein [Myxococcota bacterium]
MSDKKPKGVFVIIENERLEKPLWKRVGTAFTNRDDSLNIFLDALPLNGKLHVREVKEREDGQEREAA